MEETEITGIEFLTEEEKEGLKKARKEKTINDSSGDSKW